MVDTVLHDTGDGFLTRVESAVTNVYDLEPGWKVGLLPTNRAVPGIDTTGDATFTYLHTESEGPYPDVPLIYGADKRFLVSGVGARPADTVYKNQCDPLTRDADGNRLQPHEVNACLVRDGIPHVDDPTDSYSCITYFGSRFALAHGGTGGINKDDADKGLAFRKAKALAVLQSKYEWCRLVNHAGLAGVDGIVLSLWVKENAGSSVNPRNTPCGSDGGGGPKGVTVTIDKVTVLNDHDPFAGDINLSLAVYDSPSEFHHLDKTKSGPVEADDSDESAELHRI